MGVLCQTNNEIGPQGGDVLRDAMLQNATLRNFCFGGQNTLQPLANKIPAGTAMP